MRFLNLLYQNIYIYIVQFLLLFFEKEINIKLKKLFSFFFCFELILKIVQLFLQFNFFLFKTICV
jgi:hypothetical protein